MATILVVEDNEWNRDTLRERLMRNGYEVITATNGLEGVNKAQKQTPDLILMDMSMPIMDGWEATKQIRDNPITYSIPIIALTAHGFKQDRIRCFQVGCDDYEVKPADFMNLLGKIKTLLDKKQAIS